MIYIFICKTIWPWKLYILNLHSIPLRCMLNLSKNISFRPSENPKIWTWTGRKLDPKYKCWKNFWTQKCRTRLPTYPKWKCTPWVQKWVAFSWKIMIFSSFYKNINENFQRQWTSKLSHAATRFFGVSERDFFNERALFIVWNAVHRFQ